MAWGDKKIDWKRAVLETRDKVIEIDTKQEERHRTFKVHCKEGKEWQKGIKEEITNIKCPKDDEIDELVRIKNSQNGSVGELSKQLGEYMQEMKKEASEKETLRKVKKALWMKIGKILGIVFAAIGAVSGYVTWLMGVW